MDSNIKVLTSKNFQVQLGLLIVYLYDTVLNKVMCVKVETRPPSQGLGVEWPSIQFNNLITRLM